MRNLTLDAVKGFGIILVIIYHVIGKLQPQSLETLDNGLFNMIACFFMQLFFIISGYLVYGKLKDWKWTKPRITRWIIPLLAFMVIYWLYGNVVPGWIKLEIIPFGKYLTYTLSTGFTGLVTWYLWCLMLCYLLGYVVDKSKFNKGLTVLIAVVAVNLIPSDLLGLLYLKWYSLFFFIGYLMRHYVISEYCMRHKHINKLLYISILLIPLCGYLTNWMIDFQNIDYGYIGTAAIIPAIINGQFVLIIVMIAMALLGSACVYSLVKLIKLKWFQVALAYLGKRSVGIYLLHILFVGITENVVLSSIVALAISLTLYELLSRIKITNKYLFGASL